MHIYFLKIKNYTHRTFCPFFQPLHKLRLKAVENDLNNLETQKERDEDRVEEEEEEDKSKFNQHIISPEDTHYQRVIIIHKLNVN